MSQVNEDLERRMEQALVSIQSWCRNLSVGQTITIERTDPNAEADGRLFTVTVPAKASDATS